MLIWWDNPKARRFHAAIAEFQWQSFEGSLSFNSRFKSERCMLVDKKGVQVPPLESEQKYHSHPQNSALNFSISNK